MERTHTQPTAKKRATKATKAKRDDPEIREVLDRFARAVTTGDGAAVAAIWAVPALVLGDDATHAVSSLDQVAQFFAGAKEQYNQRGITDTRADIVRIDWATEKIAIVDVRWPYLDAHGAERGEESSTYTLRRDENGALKVCVAVMRGAKPPKASH